MERMALEEDVLSLFPKIDSDCSFILLFLISQKKKEGKVMLVQIMGEFLFSGLKGEFLPQKIKKFFYEKSVLLLTLEVKKGEKSEKVFEKFEIKETTLEYRFSEFFYKWSVKNEKD